MNGDLIFHDNRISDINGYVYNPGEVCLGDVI